MSHEKNIGLIEVLNRCAIECSHCAMACLDEDHVKMLNRCIKLDLDCAELCRTTASLLSRGSEHGEHLLKECAELCNACADECEKHSHMHHCKRCAEYAGIAQRNAVQWHKNYRDAAASLFTY